MTQSTEFLPTSGTEQAGVPSTTSHPDTDEKVEIAIALDSDLLRQIKFLTDDPSKVIEVAVRQWLRGGARRDDDLTRNLERNPPVPVRGEWND